jgi:hypothetical protein
LARLGKVGKGAIVFDDDLEVGGRKEGDVGIGALQDVDLEIDAPRDGRSTLL